MLDSPLSMVFRGSVLAAGPGSSRFLFLKPDLGLPLVLLGDLSLVLVPPSTRLATSSGSIGCWACRWFWFFQVLGLSVVWALLGA